MAFARGIRFAAGATAIMILGGCAARQQNQVSYTVASPPSQTQVDGPAASPAAPSPTPPRATRRTTLTAEEWNPRLSSALQLLAVSPAAAHYAAVGEIYMELGVLDTAYDYLRLALEKDRKSARAYDGLARIWRRWGLAGVGLGDAHRARYYAPTSPAVHNTLGTLLQRVGNYEAAERAYARAIALDSRASYAFNNLCYLAFLQGKPRAAIPHCRAALELAPSLSTARNNLALAYASTGRMDLAKREFQGQADEADAQFNLGIVLMAKHMYLEAADAFDAARAARSSFYKATTMAHEARALAERAERGIPE